jgi:hypothetical protein
VQQHVHEHLHELRLTLPVQSKHVCASHRLWGKRPS